MVRRRSLLAAAASAAGVALAACAAAPPAVEGPFTPAQVAVMKDLGFQQTDEGWQLDLGARVLFEFGSDALNPSATAAWVKKRQFSRLGMRTLQMGRQ